VLMKLTKVTMTAMYNWHGWTAKRLRRSSVSQAKKSHPCHIRGIQSGCLASGIGEAGARVPIPD
jgi:hypothetical protein